MNSTALSVSVRDAALLTSFSEYEIRNARYNHAGTIDVEWNHPGLGRWIPFTADPEAGGNGPAIYAQALAGEVAPYVPPTEQP